MKLYVINLKRRPEKRERIVAMLLKYPDLEYEIFDAIDGENIDESFMEENGYKTYPSWYDPNLRRSLTKGEIGCSLSHWLRWKKIAENNIERAIILEDDALFTSFFAEKYKKIGNYLQTADLLYLGRKVFNRVEVAIDEDVCIPNFSYWTIGYALSYEGAMKLYKSGFEKKIIPVDEFLPYMYAKNNCVQLDNYGIKQNITAYAFREKLVEPYNNSFLESDTEKSPIYEEIREDDNRLHIISVATYYNDGLDRYIHSMQQFGMGADILGMNTGEYNMLKYPGGGFKVNLLKKKLKREENNYRPDDLILFTDSFDVVFIDNKDNIIRKFEEFDGKIIFSAETFCWPDKSLESHYMPTTGRFKYLNSRGFIGKYSDICNLLDIGKSKEEEVEVLDTDDDQLYYTHKYLSGKYPIVLDYHCNIFQTINGAQDILKINYGKSNITNSETGANPSILHGNGGMEAKIYFNSICNYLPNKWIDCYGYKNQPKNKAKENTPNILLVFDTPEYMHNYGEIDYPEENLTILTFANLKEGYYLKMESADKVIVLPARDPRQNRINAIKFAKKMNQDYLFFVDREHVINNRQTLKNLISHQKKFIAPLLKKPNQLFSNFWGDVDKDGYYARSFDYLDIVQNKRQGLWNVPYVYNTFLIHKTIFDNVMIAYSLPGKSDYDMNFCQYLREKGIFMHIENLHNYGYIYLSEEESANSVGTYMHP
jgi:GR25 family glycosyltransferase involved in LPS biosynthesis